MSQPSPNQGPRPSRPRRGSKLDVALASERLGVSQSTVRRWIRTGRLNPSCVEVYARVYQYLDHELADAERAEVQRHLHACPGCEDHFRFDGTVLRWIKFRGPRADCPEPSVERILSGFRDRVAGS